jgi:hypothetical protein
MFVTTGETESGPSEETLLTSRTLAAVAAVAAAEAVEVAEAAVLVEDAEDAVANSIGMGAMINMDAEFFSDFLVKTF